MLDRFNIKRKSRKGNFLQNVYLTFMICCKEFLKMSEPTVALTLNIDITTFYIMCKWLTIYVAFDF